MNLLHLKSGNTVETLQSLVSATKRARPAAAGAANAKRGTILDRILPDRLKITKEGSKIMNE